jgi:hypothetical protein
MVACRHATASTIPRFQGQASTAWPGIQEECVMTEASVSFAGNITDDPEVHSTEGGDRPGDVPGGRLWSAGAGAVVLHGDCVA